MDQDLYPGTMFLLSKMRSGCPLVTILFLNQNLAICLCAQMAMLLLDGGLAIWLTLKVAIRPDTTVAILMGGPI